ncbi:response regulator transcription factor [Calidifontibacter sp. DB0510]|uniref:Response regulator transcription factor n=1 Tax=Metallococcus carri TaxID=1656884 RepID=A0A967B7W8_9MICO|nr:LytTR family DNA-binding domain-containing protein [Metallococcus carri]NHN56396.1 response regulator transcription factor [Metallococcus carri]NOP36020.1 response regulator transcription factor [Calidifontibacter sp. DB2511S]
MTPRLRALVVDDEAPARSELAWLLQQHADIAEVATAASGAEALAMLESSPVDVVFSDIAMPGLDGMTLAKVLAKFAERPAIVFVTAYEEHAVDAFAVDAVDYLVKPVRPERVDDAVRRCLEGLRPATGETAEEERVAVELGGVTKFIPLSEIRYAQASGDYARLHTATSSHLIRVPLTTLEERWRSAGFERIHRSTLVSLKHVTQLRAEGGGLVALVGDTPLTVSRRHGRALRGRLLDLHSARGD